MASEEYRIPWGPMDYSGIADAIRGFRENDRAKRADDRANAYLEMEKSAVKNRAERESAALARQKEQDDYNRRVKAFEAMPALYRAAHKSVGMANANPYGVKFDETMEAPDQSKANDEVGRFLAGAPHETTPETPSPARQLRPNEEGPEQDPAAEASRFASTDSLMDDATTGAPMDLMTQAAANAMGQPTRRLHATFQGQRFEVPEQSDTLGLGDEYDTIYRNLLASGEDEDAARKYVLAEHKADRTQKAIADRTAESLKGRRDLQGDRFDFQRGENEKYRNEGLSLDDRMAMIDRAGRWRVSAAGAEKPSAADAGEANIAKTFGADFKDFRDRTANALAEIKATRNVHEIEKLANSKNPVDQALAVEQIGKIAHGGNTVTKATQDLIYHHMGGAFERGEAMLKQYTDKGRLADDQIKMLKETAAGLAAHHDENKHSIEKGFEIQFGPQSMYGSEYLQPMVRQHLDALYTQMGIPAGTVAAPQTEGSIRLGRRRGEKTGAPGAKPKPAQTGSGQTGAAKKWLAENPGADPALRAKVEAKIRQLEGGGG